MRCSVFLILLLLLLGLPLPAQTPALPPTLFESQKLQPFDLVEKRGFGVSVVASPLGLFVGAGIFNQVNLPGSVYHFTRQGGTWALAATLSDPNAVFMDQFGSSIDIHDQRLVIGAVSAGTLPATTGAVFVMRLDPGGWVQEAQIIPADAVTADRFGNDVAIHGDRLLAGAMSADPAPGLDGAAYVFRREGMNWVEEQKLIPGSPTILNQFFGIAVALEADLAAVANLTGSVHHFRRTGFTWDLESVVPSTPFQFGISDVQLEAGVLYIGYSPDDEQGPGAGAVYQYELVGASWIETQKILATAGAPWRSFGARVDVDGDGMLVGAVDANGVAPESGVAHHFRRDAAGTWVETAVLMGSDSQTDDAAAIVALHGNTAVLGAPLHSAVAPDAGAAYVFEVGSDEFRRGDANGDGSVNIGDAIATLNALFLPGIGGISCDDAADANDDGSLNIADAIAILGALFGGTGSLPAPGDICGPDPSDDALLCVSYDLCP